MARKLNPEGLIEQRAYLFENHAQYRDSVFSKFKEVCQRHKLPVNLAEEKYKSGGFLGSSDVLLTVDGGYTPFAVVGATTYGDFLSVTIYFLVEDSFWNKAASKMLGLSGLQALALLGRNMLNVRDQLAFWNCVVSCLEMTFQELKFQEVKTGFLGIK